jgi:3-methyladenine DNA glycosylase Tag
MKRLISGKSDMSLQEQLRIYADRIVNDRTSMNVLQAFLEQMADLFGNVNDLLFKESNLVAGIHEGKSTISWTVVVKKHDNYRYLLSKNLDDFIFFLKRVIELAKQDARFLKRNRALIARMFSMDEPKRKFLESSQASISSEEQFITTLDYLATLKQDTNRLLKDMDKVKAIVEKAIETQKVSNKEISFLETTRFNAHRLMEEIGRIESYVPGLRSLDAESARTLGMLSDVI